MDDPLAMLVLALAALAASVLAAVTGFGGAAVLLPVLTWAFGVRDAIPILTVLQLVGNAARVAFNRADVRLPVVGWYSLGAVPACIAGGLLFASAPLPVLKRIVGAVLLLVVLLRHLPKGKAPAMRLRWFAPVGAAGGVLSSLAGTAGPVAAPFFLAYGLTRGAYIGTEALATVVMHVTKLTVYGGASVLTARHLAIGTVLGVVMVGGSYAGKRLADRLPERVFIVLVEATLVVAGAQFLATG